MKHWLAVLALLTLSWSFALTATTKTLDVNANGTLEHVVVTNLADIAFNDQGQIVGWYVKAVRGTDYKGNYSKAANLVSTNSILAGTIKDISLNLKPKLNNGMVFNQANNNPKAPFVGSFSDGSTTLTYTINPQYLTIDVNIQGAEGKTFHWNGLGNGKSLVTKLLNQGSTQPQATGTAEKAVYAAIHNPSQTFVIIAHTTLAAIVVPKNPTAITLNNVNGTADMGVTINNSNFDAKIYGGAYELVRLKTEGMYDYPGIFKPNIWGQVSLWMLKGFIEARKLTGSWFLAIILVTLAIRVVLWPVMHQQYKSSAEMQKVQPLIKALQEKYKDDREKLNTEMLKIYQEHKINPASGCLPLLIQMPFLLLITRIFYGYEFGEGMLWIKDFAIPDPIYILPVIYVAVLSYSSYISAAGNPEMIRMSLMMNLGMAFVMFQFPAGATFYWILSTLITLAQQFIIKKQLGIKPVATTASIINAKPQAQTKKSKK